MAIINRICRAQHDFSICRAAAATPADAGSAGGAGDGSESSRSSSAGSSSHWLLFGGKRPALQLEGGQPRGGDGGSGAFATCSPGPQLQPRTLCLEGEGDPGSPLSSASSCSSLSSLASSPRDVGGCGALADNLRAFDAAAAARIFLGSSRLGLPVEQQQAAALHLALQQAEGQAGGLRHSDSASSLQMVLMAGSSLKAAGGGWPGAGGFDSDLLPDTQRLGMALAAWGATAGPWANTGNGLATMAAAAAANAPRLLRQPPMARAGASNAGAGGWWPGAALMGAAAAQRATPLLVRPRPLMIAASTSRALMQGLAVGVRLLAPRLQRLAAPVGWLLPRSLILPPAAAALHLLGGAIVTAMLPVSYYIGEQWVLTAEGLQPAGAPLGSYQQEADSLGLADLGGPFPAHRMIAYRNRVRQVMLPAPSARGVEVFGVGQPRPVRAPSARLAQREQQQPQVQVQPQMQLALAGLPPQGA